MIEDIDPRHFQSSAPLTSIQSSILQSVYVYWLSLADGSSMPRKSAFDVTKLKGSIWPHLFLVDILGGDGRFRIRVLGSYLAAEYGRDYTGCLMTDAEIPNISKSVTIKLLSALVGNPTPQYYLGKTQSRYSGIDRNVEKIVLPMSDIRGDLAHALGCIHYHEDFRPDVATIPRTNIF